MKITNGSKAEFLRKLAAEPLVDARGDIQASPRGQRLRLAENHAARG